MYRQRISRKSRVFGASAPVLAGGRVRNPRHKLQGGGYAFVPPLWDPTCCDGFLTASDAEALRVARRLGREEGICAGFSSGANVAAALRDVYAAQ